MFRYLPAVVVAAALCGALSQAPTLAADAKPPTKVAFQGFLTDSLGGALGGSAPVQKTVIFRVYSDATAGTLKWSEQQAVTVDKGHFSVLLGEGSAASDTPSGSTAIGVFAGADASDRWVELSVDGNILSPRIQFVSSPYALLAKSANQVVGLDGSVVITPGSGTLTLSGVTIGTFSGDGSAVTGLNASSLASGTVADARLSANIPKLNAANTFTAAQTITGNLNVTGTFTLTGSSSVSGNATVSGALTAGSASVTGALGAGSASVTGALTTGSATVGASGLTLNGPLSLPNGTTFSAKNNAGTSEMFLWPRWTTDNAMYLNYGAGGFYIRDNSAVTTMFMTDDNKVGIGTTTPSSALHVSGMTTSDSFKLTGTPTYVLYSVNRFSIGSASPITGVTQTLPYGDSVSVFNARYGSNQGTLWYKSNSGVGTTPYSGTFVVPAGEYWEVEYICAGWWGTDDWAGLFWTVDDTLVHDGYLEPTVNLTKYPASSPYYLNNHFDLTAGTHVLRVRAMLYGGSGDDAIYFPYRTSAQICIVKKYKST